MIFDHKLIDKVDEFLKDSQKRVLQISYSGPRLNSGCAWFKMGNPIDFLIRAFLMEIVFDKLPPSRAKNFLYRLLGVKLGKDVVIGPRAGDCKLGS